MSPENPFTTLLASLEKINVIGSEDATNLKEINDQLVKHWVTNQIFRTEYEMVFSVLNDTNFPTPDAKYWQCVREQMVQLEQLVNLSFEYEKSQIKVARLEAEIKKGGDPFDIAEADIELRQIKFSMAQQRITAKDRMREILTWHGIMEELHSKLRYGTLDCSLHQPESYQKRFLAEREIAQKGGIFTLGEMVNLMTHLIMSQKFATQPLIKTNRDRALELEKESEEFLSKRLKD